MLFRLIIPTIFAFHSFTTFAQSQGKNYAILINGGANVLSNNQRYFENVRSMYEAFRGTGIPSNQIIVLYGSGKVEDTNSASTQPQFPQMGQPQYGIYSAQTGKMIPAPQGIGIASIESTKTTATIPSSTITLDYLFGGEKRNLDGGANSQTIKEKFRELRGKLKEGDNVTLYITDHGEQNPEGGSSVTLWGESMTVNELGDLLREFPQSNQIRVVTNICFGGGLTELTSSNVCVFANQEGNKPSVSDTTELDLYGQNFPYALTKKMDSDKDGKATYWDAHQYATRLDNPANLSTTSLEWFLLKNKNKIFEARSKMIPHSKAIGCENHPDDSIKLITNLIEDFERMKIKLSLSTEGVPSSRQHLVKGRLEKTIQSLKNKDTTTIMEDLDLKIQDLKASILGSVKNWDKLSQQEQAGKRQKTQIEAQQIKTKLAQLQKDRRQYEILNLELDMLKYADDNMIKEYSMIRKCLEYAY